MKLLTIGDSFTYGEELSDLTKSWPNLLAVELGYSLTNMGMPGTGNTSMVRNAVSYALEYDLIIIAWSHFARTEFADTYGIYDTWPGSNAQWVSTDTLSDRQHIVNYVNRHASDDYSYNQHLINIILVQSYLKNNCKDFIMLDAISNAHESKKSFELEKQIDTKSYLGWKKETMQDWTKNCSKGSQGHFLEEGHQIVARRINEHIRNISRHT